MTEKPTYEELIQENEILKQKLIDKDLETALFVEKRLKESYDEYKRYFNNSSLL